MNTSKALTGLSETKLTAWLLSRMRGEQVDPPVVESRLESPEDYVKIMYDQSRDTKFRARIEKATVAALREAAKGDLRGGRDAAAVGHLSALADGLGLRAAAPILREIAGRGAFGGHDADLDPDAEALVLFALAGLQAPGMLWSSWSSLWQREVSRLWPVVTAGLRLSDPKKALSILPEAVERARKHDEFPLGDVLWAFATDDRYAAEDVASALKDLSREARERCRDALRELGAEPGEIDAWVPAARPDMHLPTARPNMPPWASRFPKMAPPRFTEAPGCR